MGAQLGALQLVALQLSAPRTEFRARSGTRAGAGPSLEINLFHLPSILLAIIGQLATTNTVWKQSEQYSPGLQSLLIVLLGWQAAELGPFSPALVFNF